MFYFENENFKVTETFSGFEIESKISGIVAGLGDMVDVYLFNGNPVHVGTEKFNEMFRCDLVRNSADYINAFFPIDVEITDMQEELAMLLRDFNLSDMEKAVRDVDRIAEITKRLAELKPIKVQILCR
jgi:hypothetical protein